MPVHFEVDRLPISGPRLEHRLRLLEPVDLAEIEAMRDLLFWDRLKLDVDDHTVSKRYDEFPTKVRNPVVREIAQHRMDTRTIIAALRRRRMDMGPPEGVGQWVRAIRAHWTETDLGLGRRFDWIAPLEQALAAGDVREANRVILGGIWKHWTRMAQEFYFSFEAIALYVARWDILDRWTSQNAPVGKERFEQLLAEAFVGREQFV